MTWGTGETAPFEMAEEPRDEGRGLRDRSAHRVTDTHHAGSHAPAAQVYFAVLSRHLRPLRSPCRRRGRGSGSAAADLLVPVC